MSRKFITFDLDGILINSAGLHDEAFLEALRGLGLDKARERYSELYGVGSLMESVSSRKKCELLGLSDYYEEIKAEKDKVFHDNLHRIEYSPWLAYDLERLKSKGYEVAVVTNCTEAMAFVICAKIGLRPGDGSGRSVAVFAATEGVQTKPHPALYLKFMANSQLTGRDTWLALEDSDNGVQAAALAGATMVIKTDYHETKERLRLCAF